MDRKSQTKLLLSGVVIGALFAIAIVAMVKRGGGEQNLATTVPSMAKASASARASQNVRDRQMLVALERAASLDPSTEGNKLRALLRPVAMKFAEIQIGEERGKAHWQKVILNRAGKRMDGLRFRIPPGEPRSLYWATILPAGGQPDDWRLFAVQGEVNGFMMRRPERPEEFSNLPDVGWQPESLVLQRLLADRLESGKEYAVWFHFTTSEPVEFWLAINALPQSEGELAAVSALGLKRESAATVPAP